MTAYRDRIAGLTGALEQEVLGLWNRRDRITEEQFVAAAAAAIARANARATTLADIALAAAIAQQLGRAPAPLGLLPEEQHVDQVRLRNAVGAVLAADIATASTAEDLDRSRALRLARIARDEPAGTASAAMTRAMQERRVPGWTRVLSANACPLCQSLADGEVRPPTVQMARHTSCSCVQQPVLR